VVDRDGPQANPAHRQNDSGGIARSILRCREKPEPLKNALAGCWSRRIDQEHRLVYQVFDSKIRILACRYHY
jgi:toxin YoeB